LLLQFQADILGASVIRPAITEVTAAGAAYLAGLAVGFWKDISEIRQQWQIDKTFSPSSGDMSGLIKGWQRSVNAVKFWANNEA